QLCSLRLQDVGLVPKEIEPSHDESEAAALAVMKDGRNGVYIVVLVATKNLRRGGERLATRQPLYNVGVAGGRQVTGLPFPSDQDVAVIFPDEALLASRQAEAAIHKRTDFEIELANFDGVLPTLRKGDQAMSFVTSQAPGATENEALALGFAQRIDVKNDRPMRLRSLVVGESSLAPDAA